MPESRFSAPVVLVAGAVLLAAAALACQRPAPADADVRVEMDVTPQPPTEGVAQVEITLRDAGGRPLAAHGVEVEGNMTHPGMQPTFATASPAGPGRWVAELELTMGGDWLVGVDARLEDGRRVRRTLPLPGVVSR